jgi:hypothetical protein
MMIHPTSADARTNLPISTDFYASSRLVQVPAQPVQATQKITVQQLQCANRPPIDHANFTLPVKSAADIGRFSELDARVKFLRRWNSPEPGENIVLMVHEQHCRSLMVTREVVQDFLNDGLCPLNQSELKALALFLLTNKLFSALAWLVFQSNTDTLDLHRCNLGSEGVEQVAEWVRTVPFKVTLDLANNGIDASGAQLLAEALEADTIAHLDLGSNPLGDEGVQLLCAGLSRNSSVESLALYDVGAAGAGMKALAGVLDTHPSLSRLDLNSIAFDDAAAEIFAAALGCNKRLTSLSLYHVLASDAGLSMVVGALKTNTALKAVHLSLHESDLRQRQLPVALAEALTVNQTLTALEVFFGVITNEAAQGLVVAVARNTALQTFDCHLAAYGLTKENAVAIEQIKDKVEANALIEAAGNALSKLSQRPEWTVPIPSEVGHTIAAFVAQVGVDEKRNEAMLAIVKAGTVG